MHYWKGDFWITFCFYNYLKLEILLVILHKTCDYTVNTGKVFICIKTCKITELRGQFFDGSVIFMELLKKNIMFVIYLLSYVIRLSWTIICTVQIESGWTRCQRIDRLLNSMKHWIKSVQRVVNRSVGWRGRKGPEETVLAVL